MYNIKVLVILLVVFFLGHGCLQEKANTAFLIESHTPEIQLDGIIEESEWSVASILTNLHSPWVPEKLDSTIFRCYISENYFNFCFEVVDRTILPSSLILKFNAGHSSSIAGNQLLAVIILSSSSFI